MKILLDTNVFIALEPTANNDLEKLSSLAPDLSRIIQENKHTIFLHPKTREDIERDKDVERKKIRINMLNKYPQLEMIPITEDFAKSIQTKKSNPNDDVDNHLLFALDRRAVNILVTEDEEIHKKAKKIEIENYVYHIPDAIIFLENLHAKRIVPTPLVELAKCYRLDLSDPLFDSLRNDYINFDKWFNQKCIEEHRDCFIIMEEQGLDAICIIKEEQDEYDMSGNILKLCTFKVAEHAGGFRLGELLLKNVFKYADTNHYNWIYATSLPKHERICDFFETFDFIRHNTKTSDNEYIYYKKLVPDNNDKNKDHLLYHIQFGPKFIHPESSIYIVPIKPPYHSMLFPEMSTQPDMFDKQNPFGNGILKAYLCRSPTKTIPPGSILFFYCSENVQSIQAIGVVEKTTRSNDAERIAAFAGKRTAYDINSIYEMCKTGEVLAILFRQANSLQKEITRIQLENNNIIRYAPQSITRIKNLEDMQCLIQQTKI